MPESKNGTTKYRVERLERDVEEISEDVKKILTNHLPHLQQDIASLKTRVTIFGGLIMTAITGLIGLLISRLP